MENFQRQFIMAQLAYAVQRNINCEELCVKCGISYHDLVNNVNFAITPQHKELLWKYSMELCKDPLFGLHFGESLQLAALGVVGQIIQTSATVGEALTNASALVPLITDMFVMQIEHGDHDITIHFLGDDSLKSAYPFTYRHMADYLLVFTLLELDGLLLEKIVPKNLSIPYYNSDPYEYSRVFRNAAISKGEGLSIVIDSRLLGVPILSANYELQNSLLKKVGELQQKNNQSWSSKIFNYLLANSYLKTLSIEAVANNFTITERALQRKLKDEGTTFLQILENVRKSLAISYIEHHNFSIKEVTYILGYNEQSAFLRAFKRWTGKTPSEHKASINK